MTPVTESPRPRRGLPDRARIVIVGGGVAGCSALYHLAQAGCTDTVLVEKGQLTCGSTWHAAGLCTQFHASRPMMRLLMRSLELYRTIRGVDGQDVGLREVGSVRLAATPERVDELRSRAAMARSLGLPFELIGPAEASERFPLGSFEDVLAAAYLPTDGYVDPTLLTQALAHHARTAGATIAEATKVVDLGRRGDGWLVGTDRGTIECEAVLLACGQWTPQVAALASARLPITPLQHHFVITEGLDEVRALERELPVLRDPAASFYVRQEGECLLVGPFEPDALPWEVDPVPDDFEGRLLPGRLEHIVPVLTQAAERVPMLADAGLKNIVNGPDGYTPDGLCLMGEVPGQPGLHVLAGFSIFGIVFGGGAGAAAAEWLLDGQPSDDLWEVDVRRFGPHASARRALVARARQTYAREYAVHLPEEELPAARPQKLDPLYDRLAARGAVFGEKFGWERPLWFAPFGVEAVDRPCFRRPNWHDHVGAECRAVRERVGVLDQTSFAKFVVSGPGAAAYLSRLCCNRLPSDAGRIALTQMLTPAGGIECDVTVTLRADGSFYVVSAAAAETHDLSWLERHLPNDDSVRLENVTARTGVLTLAGPRSRELLQQLTNADVSRSGLPFFRALDAEVGDAPTQVMRLSYVGELGFELHHPVEHSRALYDVVVAAGEPFGLVDFGYRALESMRLEKGYRLWGADISADTSPLEAGLERFVDWDHDFIGRESLLAQRSDGVGRVLCTLAFDVGLPHALPQRYDPVHVAGTSVGHVVAGGFGHVVDHPIALAYLPPELAGDGHRVEVEVLGERLPATVTLAALFDPDHARLRA